MKVNVLWPSFTRTVNGIDGLAIVVVQDKLNGEVLMVAFTDEAGFKKTLETRTVSLFSTSRKKSWTKGEESGNFLLIEDSQNDIRIDCDGDALIYKVLVQGSGVACHTGARTCFYRSVIGAETIFDAPKAGPKEELEVREVEL